MAACFILQLPKMEGPHIALSSAYLRDQHLASGTCAAVRCSNNSLLSGNGIPRHARRVPRISLLLASDAPAVSRITTTKEFPNVRDEGRNSKNNLGNEADGALDASGLLRLKIS